MKQVQWDAYEIRKWAQILRANRHPIWGPKPEALAEAVLERIQSWVQIFPEAGTRFICPCGDPLCAENDHYFWPRELSLPINPSGR